MRSRIPLTVAVVGALLIGGATTGTTRASWTGQASLRSSSVASGQMSYTATTPAGVTVNKAAGSTADTTFVLDDTSAGKNLTQRITAAVASTPTGVTATIGTSCPGGPSVSVDTTPTSPDQTLCVRVTSSTTAVSGNVTIDLSSAQRPTAGWTTTPITRTFAVTVDTGVPGVPANFRCTGRANNTVDLAWSAVSGATSYKIYRRNGASAPFTYPSSTSVTSSPALAVHRNTWSAGSSDTISLILRAVNANGESLDSSTVSVTFGSSGSCSPLGTP